MVPPHLIEQFRQAQRQLLSDTYDQAWATGATGYQPDQDPDQGDELPESDGHPDVVAAVGIGTLAALLARRRRRYQAPTAVDETRKARALQRAERGLERMASELATLIPSEGHWEAARAAESAGEIREGSAAQHAIANALDDWADSNAWRLNAGESVAWAGEQDGYAAAASADGMLLEWQTESDEKVCSDCDALGSMPPMPEEDWPTTPGAGGAACEVGCRCSLEEYAGLPGDMLNVDELSSLFGLSADDEERLAAIADRAAPSLVLA